MKRLLRSTIWNSDKMANVPERYQSVYTTLFPSLYGLYIMYGVGAWFAPIFSIEKMFGRPYSEFWSAALIISAAGALLGQAVRRDMRSKLRWQQLELASLSLVIVLQSLYVYTVIAVGLMEIPPTFRTLAFLALVVYLGPPLWKVRDTIRGMRPKQ